MTTNTVGKGEPRPGHPEDQPFDDIRRRVDVIVTTNGTPSSRFAEDNSKVAQRDANAVHSLRGAHRVAVKAGMTQPITLAMKMSHIDSFTESPNLSPRIPNVIRPGDIITEN